MGSVFVVPQTPGHMFPSSLESSHNTELKWSANSRHDASFYTEVHARLVRCTHLVEALVICFHLPWKSFHDTELGGQYIYCPVVLV